MNPSPSRTECLVERVRAIPEGFVRTYGDIDAGAPQRELLLREGMPMRGARVDLREARLPAGLS
jgi:alkylated DNA nucleotide flippase Atl1